MLFLSGHTLRHILWHNDDGAARFMQIFRRLAADVVLGTTVPDLVIQLGADATDVFPFGDTLISPFSFAITTTRGGSTAGTASDVMIALWS